MDECTSFGFIHKAEYEKIVILDVGKVFYKTLKKLDFCDIERC